MPQSRGMQASAWVKLSQPGGKQSLGDRPTLTWNLQVTLTSPGSSVHQHRAGQYSLPALATLLSSRRKHSWCHTGSPLPEFPLAHRNHRSPASRFSLQMPYVNPSYFCPAFPGLGLPCQLLPFYCSSLAVPGLGHIHDGDLEPSPPDLSSHRDVAEHPFPPPGCRQNWPFVRTHPLSSPGQAALLSDLLHFSKSACQHPNLE